MMYDRSDPFVIIYNKRHRAEKMIFVLCACSTRLCNFSWTILISLSKFVLWYFITRILTIVFSFPSISLIVGWIKRSGIKCTCSTINIILFIISIIYNIIYYNIILMIHLDRIGYIMERREEDWRYSSYLIR